MPRVVLLSLVLLCAVLKGAFSAGNDTGRPLAERLLYLWPDGAPNARGVPQDQLPNVNPFWPEPSKDSGTAIIVIPGGAYKDLVWGAEGIDVSRWLADIGITGLSLGYRTGGGGYGGDTIILARDVMRAVRYVRFNAEAWGINKDRIGVMGFSAGGHLASMALTLFDRRALCFRDACTSCGDPLAKDPIDRESSRPSFGVLSYPVISMRANLSHAMSRDFFLGANASAEREEKYSAELQVRRDTPPCFTWHGTTDIVVPPHGSILFQKALLEKKIPSELHLYVNTGHGGGVNLPLDEHGWAQSYQAGKTPLSILHRWTFDMRYFLAIQGFVPLPRRRRHGRHGHHRDGGGVAGEAAQGEGNGVAAVEGNEDDDDDAAASRIGGGAAAAAEGEAERAAAAAGDDVGGGEAAAAAAGATRVTTTGSRR